MTGRIGFGNENTRVERFRNVLKKPAAEACEGCLQRLDDYIAAQLAGDAYAYLEEYPNVAMHLDACIECAGAYARLYELAVAEANDALPSPTTMPAPNLSFLETESAGLAERLWEAVIRTDDTLRLELSAGLLALLTPSEPAAALRSADDARYGEVLLRLDPTEVEDYDVPLTLSAYRDAEQPDTCLVETVVKPAGESWPNLAGRSVTLTIGDAVRTSETDSWGVAAFEGVPIDSLDEMTIDVSGL